VGADATTSGGGLYEFTGLQSGDYCVCVVLDGTLLGAGGEYDYSSLGGAQDPDGTGDDSSANGDDGIPTGNCSLSRVFTASYGGQTNTGDTGDSTGYPDNSAYMTVDFGFFKSTDGTNAVNLKAFGVEHTADMVWLSVLSLMVLMASLGLAYLRRSHMI